MDKARLQKYAELLVKKGLNPDAGQDVIIRCALDQPEFVRMVVAECYRNGAGRVMVDWYDPEVSRLDMLFQSEENLGEVLEFEVAKLKYRCDRLPAFLWLDSEDPDAMEGVDQGKRARVQQRRFPTVKPYRDAMENKFQWCIAGVPGEKWAQKVFPGEAAGVAVEKLWEAIFAAARVNGDPLQNWQEHNSLLHRRSAMLNDLHLTSLHYRAANGTDFTVGLMPQGRFLGAAEKDLSGREFNPNIPSEEIFTTPKRGEAEGLLVASKPLSWQGVMIEVFSIRFAGGKVVEVAAAKGEEALKKMVAMDEGAAMLGECALIADDSPINNSGILFYSTLYDENAACHMALGRGFDNCVADYDRYSKEELTALGVNDSMIHVDFMIGCADLDITGTDETGREIPIFRNGNWCF